MSVASVRKTAQPRRSRVDTTRAANGPLRRQYVKALGPGLVTGASDPKGPLKGPENVGPSSIALEVWHDSDYPLAVRFAGLTVRELSVPWPPVP